MKIYSTFLSLLLVMVLVSCGSSNSDTYADGNNSDMKFASNTSNDPNNSRENFRNDMEVEILDASDGTIQDKRDRNKKKKEARAKAKQDAIDGVHVNSPQEHLKTENSIKKVALPTFQTKTDNQAWTSSDVNAFNKYCIESMKNTSFVGTKYCDCLLGIMKDTYAPANMNKAVTENPKAMTCLKAK